MAGMGTKLIGFLIVLHSLMFFAGANDIIQTQGGEENQNKQFVERFQDNSTQVVDPGDQSAGIFDQIRITAKALPFIGFMYEVFSAPYTFIEGTGLPNIFVMTFQALLGFLETVVIASYIRGYDF